MKPKDCGESGEPLTDNDMFIEIVWSSGMVQTISGSLVVVQAMATIMHESMETVTKGDESDKVSQLINRFHMCHNSDWSEIGISRDPCFKV